MIDAKDTAGALYGLWRLARGDASGLDFFNATLEGFWRSFAAAVIIAPLQAIYQFSIYLKMDERPPVFRAIAIESLEYVILWVLYPFVMIYVVKLMDREPQYFRYLVAYNWFQMGVGLIVLPLAILASFSVLPLALSSFFDTITFVAYILYAIFIARTALQLTVGAGSGIVLLDIVVTLIVGQIALRMLT